MLGLTLQEGESHIDVQGVIKVLTQHGIMVEEDESQGDVSYIELLIEKRAEYRKSGEWARADKIRAELAELGIVLEDTPGRTIWRYGR
jgi:cysteinyl-tRNA synthetase